MAIPPTKSHMMPLGLMPGVRTQGLGWRIQEVHHCLTHVNVPILRVSYPNIYGLSTTPVKEPYDLFTTSSGQNCVSRLPELCFGQSKELWNWLCVILARIFNFKIPCDISVPLGHLPCHSMMSPKSACDLFTISSSQNCISWLPKFRFCQSKTFRT